MPETIKIGTLAPKSSPWGVVFETWIKAVNERSGGNLELQFFYNGQQGDDSAMIGKIKSGQLDGAATTAIGLGKIYKPILALQMPLFRSWSALDRARDALKGEFEKGAREAGFFIAGWGDVGLVRVLSRGAAIKVPDDLKGKRAHHARADAIVPALYSVVGGVTGVPLSAPDLPPKLQTGAVDVILTPALVAEQLQWARSFDSITDVVAGTAIGALVFSSKRLDALPADLRTILTDTGKVACSALAKRVRSEDDAAFKRMKDRMTVTTPGADELERWQVVFKQVRQRLAQDTFSPELVARLEGFAR